LAVGAPGVDAATCRDAALADRDLRFTELRRVAEPPSSVEREIELRLAAAMP